MNIKTVWAVYFSGTGTTEKVATTLAKDLAERLGAGYDTYCFNLPQAREKDLSFGPEDLVVLGTPVYAGRVPNLLMPYVRDHIKGNGTLGVPVVLYGNRNYDDGLIELRNLMRDNGFMPVAAGAFVGEHSFSKVLGAGRPDGDDMALVAQLGEKTAEKVKALTELPAQAVSVTGCDPIRPYYTPRDRHGEPIKDFLKAKPVTDPDKCVKCGLCARLCPMGSIDPADVSNVASTTRATCTTSMSWRTSTPAAGPPARSSCKGYGPYRTCTAGGAVPCGTAPLSAGLCGGPRRKPVPPPGGGPRLGEDRILITPSGVSKGRLEPDMLVVCDLEGRVHSGERYPRGALPVLRDGHAPAGL